MGEKIKCTCTIQDCLDDDCQSTPCPNFNFCGQIYPYILLDCYEGHCLNCAMMNIQPKDISIRRCKLCRNRKYVTVWENAILLCRRCQDSAYELQNMIRDGYGLSDSDPDQD